MLSMPEQLHCLLHFRKICGLALKVEADLFLGEKRSASNPISDYTNSENGLGDGHVEAADDERWFFAARVGVVEFDGDGLCFAG